ncbi:MAG: cell division protein FtsL [Pseudomonadales bacterium]|nr:cell division protein FtsL [Pseudomonadales bacterium]
MKGAQSWFILALLVVVVASGVQVALKSHEVRRLHAELQAAQRTQDELLAEYSRLLLERSTQAAFHNVERIAETELSMQFPDAVERLEP